MKQTAPSPAGSPPAVRPIADNRRAFHEFHILERYECGMELAGTEVQSLRMGKVQLADAFARIEDGQVWLYGVHISPYTHGHRDNKDPVRRRRLLLHKQEIMRLLGKTREKGLTLVPLRFYFKGDWAKCELGLAKGKLLHDKRDALKQKEAKRDVARALKDRSRD